MEESKRSAVSTKQTEVNEPPENGSSEVISKQSSRTDVSVATTSSSKAQKCLKSNKAASKYERGANSYSKSKQSNSKRSSSSIRPRHARSNRATNVKCPICLVDFPSYEIERHVTVCLELSEIISEPKSSAKTSTAAKKESAKIMNCKASKVRSKKIENSSIGHSDKKANDEQPDQSHTSKTFHIPDATASSKNIKRKIVVKDEMTSSQRKKRAIEMPYKRSSLVIHDDKRDFEVEKCLKYSPNIFTSTLDTSEKSKVLSLDLKIQECFPSSITSKMHRIETEYQIPVLEKPFASVNDARHFLVLLQELVSSPIKCSIKPSNIIEDKGQTPSFALGFIKMVMDVGDGKTTIPQFINTFLLLIIRVLLLDIDGRKKKAMEIFSMFTTFLPCSHNLKQNFPEITELLALSTSACPNFEAFFRNQS